MICYLLLEITTVIKLVAYFLARFKPPFPQSINEIVLAGNSLNALFLVNHNMHCAYNSSSTACLEKLTSYFKSHCHICVGGTLKTVSQIKSFY